MSLNVKSITVGLPVSNLEKSASRYEKILMSDEKLIPVEGVIEYLIGSVWIQLFEEKINVIEKIQYNQQRLLKLKVKLKELENIKETGNVRLCFGSKKLFRQQFLMFIILTLIEQCDNKDWALHSMVMPILLLLCIRKEHVDSKVYKYEGIRIRVIFRECSCKERGRG